ncbi:MAG: hypothetical protein KDA84_04650 [Planctomycetaceae bacterium]|nr:hypothetical protein [Planctomycetaceae bacterium]
MANLDFYAVRDDLKCLIDFLIGETDVRIFESYSKYSEELREFADFEDLCSAFDVGLDEHGSGNAVLLQLWSPSVMPNVDVRRIELLPSKCDGHTFRYCIEGWGLIQLYLGGIHNQCLTNSHYGHNSQRRAENWGHAEDVDWDALKKLSNRIQYHIRRRLAVAKVPGRPILPAAFRLLQQDFCFAGNLFEKDNIQTLKTNG